MTPMPNTQLVCHMSPTNQLYVACGLLGISQIAQWKWGAGHWNALCTPVPSTERETVLRAEISPPAEQ